MKKLLFLTACVSALLVSSTLHAQKDKSKRASPPAEAAQTLNSGATVTINYSQPSLKDREIGKDVEPMKGKVWRMGANEATVFEVDQNVTIEGQALPAGKYSLFGISEDDGFRLIFNKNWEIWGTQYAQNSEADALSVLVQPSTSKEYAEKLTYTVDKSGQVKLHWGNMVVGFSVGE